MNIRPAACIITNNKILLLRYEYNNVDVYNLPGGNYEEGETIAETLKRELMEELGVGITIGDLMFTAEIKKYNSEESTLHLIFNCHIDYNEPVINEKETSAKEIVWWPIELLTEINMYPSLGKQIKSKISKNITEIYLGRIKQTWY
jgi:8-oxo-dGTP diphosphatase